MKWDKILLWAGGVLILYSIIFGLAIPLKPGIINLEPFNVKTGESTELKIGGYNTSFDANRIPDVYLKFSDKQFLKLENVKVNSKSELTVSLILPKFLPLNEKVTSTVLIVNDKTDGAMVKPNALSVVQDSVNPSLSGLIFLTEPIGKLNHPSGKFFPFRLILEETIRNTYYHVPLWFAMMIVLLYAAFKSYRYLRTKNSKDDSYANSATAVGLILGLFGLATGAIWAKFTWGEYWSGDVKQNMTAIFLLIYGAYFVLRSAIDDDQRSATLAGAYNIFAFLAMIPLLFVIPRMTDSLHPGNGGNPAMGGEDLDNTMRMIFYPACLGWIFFSLAISIILGRYLNLKYKYDYESQ